jgi:hypothetical protein
LSDDIESIQEKSLKLIFQMAEKIGEEEKEQFHSTLILPFPFKEYPNVKCRRMVKSNLKYFLEKTSNRIIEWDIFIRKTYFLFLSKLLIFCEEYSVCFIKNIFMMLLESLNEPLLNKEVRRICIHR